ncbi:hypothetical protein QYE76_049856 [Lolium multiflorum]|uniref:Uncharacterized protein n=1 Tax=Lolium multiflorum TaxID=4521 RepID=A0AAD8SQG4_LOLMU|nr:hypothetical protein QYE76_049856 [Lolium multiflorum]
MLGDKDAGGRGGQRNRSFGHGPTATKDGQGRVHHHRSSSGGSGSGSWSDCCFRSPTRPFSPAPLECLLAHFFDSSLSLSISLVDTKEENSMNTGGFIQLTFFDRTIKQKSLDLCNTLGGGVDLLRQWRKHLAIAVTSLAPSRTNTAVPLGEGRISRAQGSLTRTPAAGADNGTTP